MPASNTGSTPGSSPAGADRAAPERGAARPRMTLDQAVRHVRARPEFADLVRDAYLGPDAEDSARRFERSAEFAEVRRLVGDRLPGGVVLDLGAGIGLASRAFALAGAREVLAVEPDSSGEVGRGALAAVCATLPVRAVDAFGESLPVADESVDVVYTRQVLHHTTDLAATLRECARVLRPGGVFLGCREHVVRDQSELATFLAAHPMHQLAGGEHAYTLDAYEGAVRAAGLQELTTFGPWDTVINAFPAVRSADELAALPRTRLVARFGRAGALAAALPGVRALMWRRIRRHVPGDMYTFLARKPAGPGRRG